MRSPCTVHVIHRSANCARKDARLAEEVKLRVYRRSVWTALRNAILANALTLCSSFTTPGLTTRDVHGSDVIYSVRKHAATISMRSASLSAGKGVRLGREFGFGV